MAKYHINKQGIPTLCKAKKQPCPLGEHFDTEEEANNYIQNEMSTEFGIMPTLKENHVDNIEELYNLQMEKVKRKNFSSLENEEKERTKLAKLSEMKQKGNTNEVLLKDVLSDLHSPDSGATISINNDKTVTIPTTGFCASPYPQYSKVFESSKEVNFDSVLNFVTEIQNIDDEIFSQDETYIGLWNDPETGKIYLDISKRYHTAKEARIACEENDQIAYFDLQLFESVDVDRKATSGQLNI